MQLNPSSGVFHYLIRIPLDFRESISTYQRKPLALSPEYPGLLQTPSVDATKSLPAKQPINATSMNWSAFRALQPHEQGSPPFPCLCLPR
ncbi:hypothetical protein E2320_008053, partial [Naja naja]